MKTVENINGKIYFVTTINAVKCITTNGFLIEMANSFDFPSYFGNNLDAMDECMIDLSWIKERNFKVAVKNIEVLKKRNIKQADLLIAYLNNYKACWDEKKDRPLSKN